MKIILNINLLILLLVIVSCNETDDSIHRSDEFQVNSESIILDNVPFIRNPYDVEKYLEVYEDLDDERINRSLYEVSVISRDIFKTKEWNELIILTAKRNLSSTINMHELVEKTNLKSTNRTIVKLNDKLQNIDLTYVSRNPLKSGVVENYAPAIYVPNIGIADFTKQPIICPGVEVNSELPGTEELEGYIVGWTYSEDDELQEFIFNEETAMNTTHPIFVVTNACEELMNLSNSYNTKQQVEPVLKSTTGIKFSVSLKECNLNYRFESCGNSEYAVNRWHILPNGVHQGAINGLNKYEEEKIAEVDKDDIGKDLTIWFKLAVDEYEDPLADQGIFWNTFERDWWRSPKLLGSPSLNGTKIYLYGNMHYSSDWYAFDPDDIMESRVDLETLYSSWAIWYESDHAKERLWRTSY